jgi:hypothetical protein
MAKDIEDRFKDILGDKKVVNEEVEQEPVQEEKEEVQEIEEIVETEEKTLKIDETKKVDLETGEIIVTTSQTGQKTVDNILDNVVKKYERDRLSYKRVTENEVKTTVYLEEDVYDKLSEICYRQQGLRKILINEALKEILFSGRAEEIAKVLKKAKKDREIDNKKYYERKLLKPLGLDKKE